MNLDLIAASPYVAYLGPLLALGLVLKNWGGFKKSRADATKILVDSSVKVVETLRRECKELEEDLQTATTAAKALSSDLKDAQAEIADLRGQVDRMSKDLTAAHAELATFRTGERRQP